MVRGIDTEDFIGEGLADQFDPGKIEVKFLEPSEYALCLGTRHQIIFAILS